VREWFSLMKPRWLISALLAIVLFVAAGVYAVRRRAPAPNSVQPIAQNTRPAEISLPATLRAARTVAVPVPIEGKIEAFLVEVGDEVYEGQLLAHVRSEALEAVKQAAETDLEGAETRVRTLEASLSAARLEASRASADASRVRNDLDRASKNFQRQKMLLDAGATPRLVFEKAQNEYTALEAESKKLDLVSSSADERITSVQRELDAARKLLQGKSEDLETVTAHLGTGDVLSPATGVVVSRKGQPGDIVHPSMNDLFQIASDLSTMQAVAEASPAQIAGIKPGQPATVVLAEMGGEMLQGAIANIENGTITVEFANPDVQIKPGLTAQIRLKLP
jgi:multidrug resistance efflux pump